MTFAEQQAEALIARYGLQPHTEGGWYAEQHRSLCQVRRHDATLRSALTVILFLLRAGEVSRWHRVNGADESWHFAGGDPLELISMAAEGPAGLQRQLLGSPDRATAVPLAVVPSGHWQAARSTGTWSLVSCCVGPGFDFADFTLLRDLPREQWPASALPAFL